MVIFSTDPAVKEQNNEMGEVGASPRETFSRFPFFSSLIAYIRRKLTLIRESKGEQTLAARPRSLGEAEAPSPSLSPSL